MFKRVGIVCRLDDKDASALALRVYRFLRKRGVKVYPEIEFARSEDLADGRPLHDLDADLIVTIGGDGTVLKTCMVMPKSDTPILSVNMGRRGYLAGVSPKQAILAVRECIARKCKLEEHMKLSVKLNDKILTDGLNESLVTAASPSKMLRFRVSSGDDCLANVRADGLIVATPTGSTAHAMSAGGPILDDALNAFSVTFICPLEPVHSIVVPAEEGVRVELLDPRPRGLVIVDGRFQMQLPERPVLRIERSPRKAVFVRVNESFMRRNLRRLTLSGA